MKFMWLTNEFTSPSSNVSHNQYSSYLEKYMIPLCPSIINDAYGYIITSYIHNIRIYLVHEKYIIQYTYTIYHITSYTSYAFNIENHAATKRIRVFMCI